MSTSFFSADDYMLMTRFASSTGPAIQMELTPSEFLKWADQEIFDEGENSWGKLNDFVNEFKGEIIFDTAARRNKMARDLEAHRFFDAQPAMQNLAKRFREYAACAARDGLQLV